jgi:hypothetical protein
MCLCSTECPMKCQMPFDMSCTYISRTAHVLPLCAGFAPLFDERASALPLERGLCPNDLRRWLSVSCLNQCNKRPYNEIIYNFVYNR